MIICPKCTNELVKGNGLYCDKCNVVYPDVNGITNLSVSTATVDQESFFPRESFDKILKYENDHFWYKARRRIINAILSKYLDRNSKLLEVGCGNGNVTAYLKQNGWNVDCGDLFYEGLSHCKNRLGEGNYYQYNLYDRVFTSEYDCICAFDVIEHIDDDLLVLRNMFDGLKEGGFLLITVPAYKFMWSSSDTYAGHKRRYTASELNDKLKQCGFNVEKSSYFMTLLFPELLAYRIFSKYLQNKKSEKLTSEEKISPLINEVFYRIFSLEVTIVRHLNLPYGNSIICLARK